MEIIMIFELSIIDLLGIHVSQVFGTLIKKTLINIPRV